VWMPTEAYDWRHESLWQYFGAAIRWPRLFVAIFTLFAILPAARMAAQTPKHSGASDALHSLNDSIEALVRNVSPSVVQIVVTGYELPKKMSEGKRTW